MHVTEIVYNTRAVDRVNHEIRSYLNTTILPVRSTIVFSHVQQVYPSSFELFTIQSRYTTRVFCLLGLLFIEYFDNVLRFKLKGSSCISVHRRTCCLLSTCMSIGIGHMDLGVNNVRFTTHMGYKSLTKFSLYQSYIYMVTIWLCRIELSIL
mgnify:CR=1 FL=1